jgi:hypothetical protein
VVVTPVLPPGEEVFIQCESTPQNMDLLVEAGDTYERGGGVQREAI